MARVWWLTLSLVALTSMFSSWAWSTSLDRDFSTVIERVKRATVGILRHHHNDASSRQAVRSPQLTIRGTGVLLQDGYLLTARHAVERQQGSRRIVPRTIAVLTSDLHELPATLVGEQTVVDIVVYRVDPTLLPPSLLSVPFGKNDPKPGDEVFTVGYPLGWGPAMSFGRVGNPRTFLPTAHTRLIQVDLSACRGNSGGGLFNASGELVGMVHAIIQTESMQEERRCSRFAFAVPGSLIGRVADALIHGKHLVFPKLGLRLTAAKLGTQWRIAVASATGPARKGGIHRGDILLSVNQIPLATAAELKTFLLEHAVPGQPLTFEILRDGSIHRLTIEPS
ncbi:MAG: serine protease [Nitrospirae bacterium]|nr:MAG: serine protease [Nitrospirota bacterium]